MEPIRNEREYREALEHLTEYAIELENLKVYLRARNYSQEQVNNNTNTVERFIKELEEEVRKYKREDKNDN